MGENAEVSNPYAPPDPNRPPVRDPERGGAHPPTDLPSAGNPPTDLPHALPHTDHPPTDHPPTGEPPSARPPGDPAGAERASRLARVFAALVLAGVVSTTFPVPWQAANLAFGLGALVVGVWALVVAVRARVRGAMPGLLGVGVVVAAFWLLFSFAGLLLWSATSERQQCLDGALTQTARAQCDSGYTSDVDELRERLERRLPSPAPRG